MIGRRKSRHDLPERVYLSRGWYFYAEPRPGLNDKWHKLGKKWDLAARIEWARLTGNDLASSRTGTFAEMLDTYIASAEKAGKLKPRTIADSKIHAVELKRIFGAMLPNEITQQMVAQYIRRRKITRGKRKGEPAPVRANREKATLSSAFSWAMGEGLAKINPAYGVRNNPEPSRDRAPELWEIRAVQKHSTEQWKQVIELALLVGQRGIDLRQLTRQDIRDDGVLFVQTKRGAKVLVQWDDALRAVVDRLKAIKKGKIESIYLIPAKQGRMYTPTGWGTMFYKAVKAAIAAGDLKEPFVFHDIRAANATMEDEQGGSAQKRLGHTTQKQTADYVRGKRPTRVQPLKLGGEPK